LSRKEVSVETERNIYLKLAEIPRGVKVLGIRIKDPLLQLAWSAGPDSEATVYQQRVVYVELTETEFAAARGDQTKIDALGRQFGPLVQHRLGASWYRWIEEDRT
jgi:hypothetical protein